MSNEPQAVNTKDQVLGWMKRHPKITAGIVIGFTVLAAMSGGDKEPQAVDAVVEATTPTTQAPTTTEAPTTTQAPTTAAPTTLSEAENLQLMRDVFGPGLVREFMVENDIPHSGIADDAIVTAAEGFCDVAERSDGDALRLVAMVKVANDPADSGWTDEQALAIVGYTLGVYCPEIAESLS